MSIRHLTQHFHSMRKKILVEESIWIRNIMQFWGCPILHLLELKHYFDWVFILFVPVEVFSHRNPFRFTIASSTNRKHHLLLVAQNQQIAVLLQMINIYNRSLAKYRNIVCEIKFSRRNHLTINCLKVFTNIYSSLFFA